MIYGVHWFRRDLRITGNTALQRNLELSNGKVLGLFFFDKKFLSRSDISWDRFQFFLETLKDLKKNLISSGSDLLVMDTGPEVSLHILFSKMKDHSLVLPRHVSWSRDYEPFARERDAKVEKLLLGFGVSHFSERDHLVIEPHELLKDNGTPYSVYTPFKNKWLGLLQTPSIKKRIEDQLKNLKARDAEKKFQKISWKSLFDEKIEFQDQLETYLHENKKKVSVPIPDAGFEIALSKLKNFSGKTSSYPNDRDIPSIDGTSQMSFFLKNGSMTTSQIIAAMGLAQSILPAGRKKYLEELIWREFYYHILFHFPHVEGKAFKSNYDRIHWQNNDSLFEKWKAGETGYPIVDAGMRQLSKTGWMHNRVRMIVASFLVKDLLIDWRWGEKYFMQKLLDGDLAPNNGGWQWCASTGCDAQPYFRIFNPQSQSEKFDPEGVYIKTWVSELRHLSGKEIHSPPTERIRGKYPTPIVNHSAQRLKALDLYKTVKL